MKNCLRKILWLLLAIVLVAVYKQCNRPEYLPDNICAKMTCKQREGFCIPCPVLEPPTVKIKE